MISEIIELERFLVDSTYTIRNCMVKIDANKKGAVFVVDSIGTLKGSLSDGDIRRAILNGSSTEDTIENIFYKEPIFLRTDYSETEAQEYFTLKKISIIPVLDQADKVTGVLNWSTSAEEFPAIENFVILMVGGLGSRLAPLTDNTPKPLLKVGDKPILETIFERLRMFGFRNIILCTGYRHDDIVEFSGNGERFGLKIHYYEEEKRLGTIGAIKYVEDKLKLPFLVMNGDLLTLLNYRNILNYHTETSSELTIGSTSHQMKVPYGVLDMDGIVIKRVVEKPTYNFRVSGGIYVMSPSLLSFIPKGKYFDITDLMAKALEDDRKLTAFPIEEYWMDIGQHQDYKRANSDFIEFFK